MGRGKKKKGHGKELILDLFGCDKKIISSRKSISEYADKVCKVMKAKRYGRTIIERFGSKSDWGEGYSFLQFIETSSITGHFLEPLNIGYINIFFCRIFDEKKPADFTKKFFKAKRIKKTILIR